MSEVKLALAIQKPTGNTNLGDETRELLLAGGLKYRLPDRVDFGPTRTKGLELVTMRNGDLVRACALGAAGLAIVGRDKYWNYEGDNIPLELKELGYSECKLKLGIAERFPYTGIQDLEGQTIATSYVNGSRRWFREQGINVKTEYWEGGIESYVARGFAEACIDVSETGNSMRLNGIRPVVDVLDSQAILIANPQLAEQPELQPIVLKALRIIVSGLWQTQSTLLKFNYPKEKEEIIMKETPSRESPTKMPLEEEGWNAAETLIPIKQREVVEDRLLELGARDLFYAKVERSVPNNDDPEVTRMMRVIFGANWQFRNELLKS